VGHFCRNLFFDGFHLLDFLHYFRVHLCVDIFDALFGFHHGLVRAARSLRLRGIRDAEGNAGRDQRSGEHQRRRADTRGAGAVLFLADAEQARDARCHRATRGRHGEVRHIAPGLHGS